MSAPPPQSSGPRVERKGSPTPAKPAVPARPAPPRIPDGTGTEQSRPSAIASLPKPIHSPGRAPLYPVQPLPDNPGARRLYWITVREEWDADGGITYRLFNHDSRAGDRLWKGAGEQKKPILWPFDNQPGWMAHDNAESAGVARKKLQNYLDKIEIHARKSKPKNDAA